MGRPAGYVARAERYARHVLAGKIPACQWVKFACQRHLNDLERAKRSARPWRYKFDSSRAERACRFIELMPHTKGKWARKGERLRLEDWQVFKTVVLFGWVHRKATADKLHRRRFRRAFILEPRKQGKSAWAAAVSNYMAWADGEFGAEIYIGATTEHQAWEVFGPARLMALRSPDLLAHFGIEVNARNVHRLADGSKIEPIIGNPGDGASPSFAVTDEYHEHKTDTQVDTMVTGMGAREQPLHLVISTAGDNIAGPCYAAQLEAQKVLSGVLENDELFAIIYGIDPGDDWTTEAALRKANPNYDVSVGADFLRARQREAIGQARKQGVFKTKHLNVWVGARAAAFNLESWIGCAKPGLTLEQFRGHRALIGLDLASRTDIAAMEILIPLGDYEPGVSIAPRFARFGRYFLPRDTIEIPENEHYQAWRNAGLLQETDGAIIDFDEIYEAILDVYRVHGLEIEGIGADPAKATHLLTRLINQSLPVQEVGQTSMNLSEPMKTMDALMLTGAYEHDGDPVMTWMVSNVTNRPDAKERWYPRKEVAENKIDGVLAHLNALAIHMGDLVEPESVYETRGLVSASV